PPPPRILADGHQPKCGQSDGRLASRPAIGLRQEPPKNLNSYRITEADRLGDGGPKQKFQRNLLAIRTLRTLEAHSRPATNDEKAALVKYVGWGAMPQVFDDYAND